MNFLGQVEQLSDRIHAGQFRRDGVTPYKKHIDGLVNRLKKRGYGDDVLAVGYLHDTLEMGGTMNDLKAIQLPQNIIYSVRCITRFPAYTYKDYLKEVVKDIVARTVKVFDNIENLADDPTNDQIIRYASSMSFIMSNGGILPAVQ